MTNGTIAAIRQVDADQKTEAVDNRPEYHRTRMLASYERMMADLIRNKQNHEARRNLDIQTMEEDCRKRIDANGIRIDQLHSESGQLAAQNKLIAEERKTKREEIEAKFVEDTKHLEVMIEAQRQAIELLKGE